MALLNWRKDGGDKKPPEATPSGEGAFEFSPEKAKRFFDRAQTMHEATNFSYAMHMWLQGLRFEPTNMPALKGFFDAAGAFMNSKEGGKGPPKETYKEFSGKADLDKYLHALLDWSAHPTEAAYAIKALERATGLGLKDPAAWIGERALGAAIRDKKPRKEYFVAIMQSLAKADRFDLAVQAGEQAVRMDPADGALAAEVKNLSAEGTMKRGGFDQTGEEGGFRANIRDAAKQRQLDENERLSKSEDVLERQIESARAAHEASPLDKPLALKYVDLLLQRDQEADRSAALVVLDDMYRKTQEYRFRERADAIRLRQMRARLRELKAAAELPGAGDDAKATLKQAYKEFLIAQIKAATASVAAYPTDLPKKFELGKLLFEARKFEDAIGLFQEAQADPKTRAEVLRYLGLAFSAIGYLDEAIGTLRQALSMHADPDDKTGMELRYAMMDALRARAIEQRALADAEEAYKVASAITIKQINFRDVRQKRDELKVLVTELKSTGAPPAAGA